MTTNDIDARIKQLENEVKILRLQLVASLYSLAEMDMSVLSAALASQDNDKKGANEALAEYSEIRKKMISEFGLAGHE